MFTPKISRVMVIGWCTLALGILALPQFTDVVPIPLPVVACLAGTLTLIVRWLGDGLGVNPLSAVGVVTLLSGLLGLQTVVAIIPPTWEPVLTMIAAVCTLIARVYAGRIKGDPAAPVNLVMRTGAGT